ncbi:hypothetical protein CD122_08680 [Staphylococcus rostri]|uniref:DUF1737 domain-containing protein n=1 Tax=Staphylococcus rostri TaxID=522262 RepID=A0A2K3YKM2_9STAP|nr:hypothetical protein [Staphylococcus rostri]PNZ26156.1 hypothetical protein CD122_08680 [Staphylococcus rostri]
MEQYHHLVVFDDDWSIDRANDALKNGWELIHVGTKTDGLLDNSQAVCRTVFIFGLNKEQYDNYLETMNQPLIVDDIIDED